MTAVAEQRGRDFAQGWHPDAESKVQRRDEGETPIYVGLSAYDVPQELTIHVRRAGSLSLWCAYADKEKPLRGVPLPGNPGILVHLGKHSRKVIGIEAENGAAFLESWCRLDPLGIANLASKLTSHQSKVLVRNAALLNDVVRTMPKQLRKLALKVARGEPVTQADMVAK